MNLILLINFFNIFLLPQSLLSVQINYIKVPPALRNNSNVSAILDCNYSVRPGDTDLVVKWLRNEEVVYQWIPPGLPQSLGSLKDRIDLTYNATNDPTSIHRAMKIINPTTDIAGEYKCFVSTFADEDFSSKNMIVFEPERTIKILESPPVGEKVNFTCLVTEVYPPPKIFLFRDRKEDIINKTPLVPIHWEFIRRTEDGRFSSFVTSTALVKNLASGDLINCEISIPSTGYIKRKTHLYFISDTKWKSGHVKLGLNIYILLAAFVISVLIN